MHAPSWMNPILPVRLRSKPGHASPTSKSELSDVSTDSIHLGHQISNRQQRPHDTEKQKARQMKVASCGPGVSSIIIIISITAVIVVMLAALDDVTKSLEDVSSDYRRASAERISEEVAVTLAPDWHVTRTWLDMMNGDVPNSIPSREIIEDFTLLEAHAALTRFPFTDREAHLKRYSPGNGGSGVQNATYSGYVGCVGVVTDTDMAADRAAQQSTSGPKTSCVASWTAGFLRLPFAEPPQYIVDRIVANESVSNTPGGVAGYTRSMHPYIPSLPARPRLIKKTPIRAPPPLDCVALMEPLWSPLASPMNPTFSNFTWFGPYNPGIGWGNQFEGSIPIYDGSRIIGRASSAVALTSISEALLRVIDSSESFNDAIMAVYTPDAPSLGPFGSVLIAQTLSTAMYEGLGSLVTLRVAPDANDIVASAPVSAPQPPGPYTCTMCIPAGDPATADPMSLCPDDACSVQALRTTCPTEPFSVINTPKGLEFTCAVASMASLAAAFRTVKDNAGVICTADRQEIDDDDLLIDVTPFRMETYGLPAFAPPGYWCQIAVIPRKNFFEGSDNAKEDAGLVMAIALTGIILGVLLLLTALCIVNSARRTLISERRQLDIKAVHDAVDSMKKMNHPMVLLPAELFASFAEMPMHETLRDDTNVALFTLNSVAEIKEFRRKRRIIFVSHQWLSRATPDPDKEHFKSICLALDETARSEGKMLDQYAVWLDYTSVPQKHVQLQMLAISSLPIYAAQSDIFIAVAPDVTHKDSRQLCTLETYKSRGWCRLEMLGKVCGSGDRNCKMVCGETSRLQDLPVDEMSVFVFEGEFSVSADKMELVVPALGLYSLIIQRRHKDHMRLIYDQVQEHKGRFFPPTFIEDGAVRDADSKAS